MAIKYKFYTMFCILCKQTALRDVTNIAIWQTFYLWSSTVKCKLSLVDVNYSNEIKLISNIYAAPVSAVYRNLDIKPTTSGAWL